MDRCWYLRHGMPMLPGLLQLERDVGHVTADVDLADQSDLEKAKTITEMIDLRIKKFI